MGVFRSDVAAPESVAMPPSAVQVPAGAAASLSAAGPAAAPAAGSPDASSPVSPVSKGAPMGHLERAFDACLAARKALADMAARAGEGSPYAHGIVVGVDSGPLISGSIGSRVASRLDYTVLGEVVNNASRLQAGAQKGQILINAALYQRVEGMFECEAVPQHD